MPHWKLLDVEEQLNLANVGLVNQSGVGEITFLSCLFLGQDVPFVGMLPLDFTRASEGEPLLCARVGLHFWHFVDFLGHLVMLMRLVSSDCFSNNRWHGTGATPYAQVLYYVPLG